MNNQERFPSFVKRGEEAYQIGKKVFQKSEKTALTDRAI